MEGLFRNGTNPDLAGNVVTANVEMTQILATQKPTAVLDESMEVQSPLSDSIPTTELKNYLKFIISIKDKRYEVLQLVYNAISYNPETLERVKLFSSDKHLFAESPSFLSRLLYALIMMFSINDAQELSKIFKEIEPQFLLNKEILNTEKIGLYHKYKQYLLTLKSDPSLKSDIKSPYDPEDPSKAQEVKEILSQSMYQQNDKIKLVKINDEFFWRLQLPSIEAYFFHETEFMKSLKIVYKGVTYEMTTEKFILYDGNHQLPRSLMVTVDGGPAYKLQFISYKQLVIPSYNMSERRDYYDKELSSSLATRPRGRTPFKIISLIP